MKTRNIISASILAVILLLTAQFASAANPVYYVCIGSTLSLAPDPITNVTYSWDVKDLDGTTSLGGYPRAGAPTTLPNAVGTYKVRLISTPNITTVCAPDVIEYDFVVLPALTSTIGAPTQASYCETQASGRSSGITPTSQSVPNGAGYPSGIASDLEIEYTYTVSKDLAAEVNGSTLGTINAADGVYTFNAVVPGSYVITGHAKYKQKTGFTGKLISTGCIANSTTQTITVTAKPTVTIAISAN